MARLFEVKAVVPDLTKEVLKSKRVRAMVLNEMKGVGKLIQRDLYKTVMFWKHKVVFQYNIHYAGGDVYLLVGPVYSPKGVEVWNYVDKGTASIPFIFHPKYVPKTEPSTAYPLLASTRGQYTTWRRILRDENNKPIPGKTRGIRPRNWSAILQIHYTPYLYDAVDFAVKRGLDLI